MSLTPNLALLESVGDYPGSSNVQTRWGELLRRNASLSAAEAKLIVCGKLTRLASLGTIKGGVVTRANAYFLLTELSFDQIPARMRVTRGDLARLAVVKDGLDHIAKIEKVFLKPVLKGPESLESAFAVKRSNLRLLDVRLSKHDLLEQHANGVVNYLRRR